MDGSIAVEVALINTGKRKGNKIAQLYVLDLFGRELTGAKAESAQ